MTLHAAIKKLLLQFSRPMTTKEIAEALNSNKWYVKKDGSVITALQIHGRTRKYEDLFDRKGAFVSLRGKEKSLSPESLGVYKPERPQKEITVRPGPALSPTDLAGIESTLMDKKRFVSAGTIDSVLPVPAGLYCIRLASGSELPRPFDSLLRERGHNIIYMGIASQSLRRRFLGQELRARGHGTFFRSIGAVLGYRPAPGSLRNKANKRNFTFLPDDEQKIITWINHHLLVNWVVYNGNFEEIETAIIRKYRPLLNISKNPAALKELTELRTECIKIAAS